MWCEVYSHGPYFFENAKGRTVTVNSEQFKVILETFLRSELHPCQQDLLFFQHDGANAHTAEISMQVLRTVSRQTHFSFWGHHLAHPLA
jgi:hypothetical protein